MARRSPPKREMGVRIFRSPYMPECPTCGDEFKSDNGVAVHHSHVHGESIAKDSSTCDTCGDKFEYYPSKNCTGTYCSIECNTEIPDSKRSLGNRYNSIEKQCDNCGNDIIIQHSNIEDHNFCDRKCYGEWKTSHGESSDLYRGWYSVREKVLDKYGDKCQYCGVNIRKIDSNITVHHCIPIRIFDNPEDAHYTDNGIVLCESCHIKIEERLRGLDDSKFTERLKC